MSESNTSVKISTDGSVSTFDVHGVRVNRLCGNLTMLHKLIRINRMPARDKGRLITNMRIRNARFFFVSEITGDSIEIPTTHLVEFVKGIERGDVDEFVKNLLLQIPE